MNEPTLAVGLLWFDDDPKHTFEEKVHRAVAHYERKYRRFPTLCYVHPSALDHPYACSGVEVRPYPLSLPGRGLG